MIERRASARLRCLAAVAVVVVLLGACGLGDQAVIERDPGPDTTTVPRRPGADQSRGGSSANGSPEAPAPTTPEPSEPIEISLRMDRRVTGQDTDGFEDVVRTTLADPRGWEQAGFRFRFDDPTAPFVVVLAEGTEVDDLCAPYDTGGRFSCQIGPVVALNADRWREATPEWTGDLDTYRQMLVNHEVGHLLGQNHPTVPCPAPGEPAPVMTQQSTSLRGCLPNPWPLPWELDCAAIRGLRPLAPPFERVDGPLCGPDGPTGSATG